MQYLGGKSRISKEISEIINKYSKDRNFVSLFCGACSIESKVIAKSKICNDSHKYLIELLKAVQDGYELPNFITKEEYDYIFQHKDKDEALTGFVGFGCSFGGKWKGGYAKNNSGTNYCLQAKNSLLKKMIGLQNATFLNLDYRDVKIKEGSIVYCDPPYKDTTNYSNSSSFSHKEFWEYIRELSKKNIVFVSELTAPSDFHSIWEKPFKRVLDVNKDNIFTSQEKLFVHQTIIDKL